MRAPPQDTAALATFPRLTARPGDVFHRVHLAWHEPTFFSTTGAGRFDPPPHSREEYGTCYLAASPAGAFLETLGRIRPLPEKLVDDRVISELTKEFVG